MPRAEDVGGPGVSGCKCMEFLRIRQVLGEEVFQSSCRGGAMRRWSQTFEDVVPELSSAVTLGLVLIGPVMAPSSWGPSSDGAITGPSLGLSSEERWLVQGLMPLLDSLLLGLNPVQPAFLDTVLASGLARYGGAWAGPAKAQLLCLPVAFLCLNPVSLPAMWELAPGLFVSSPALGPFLWCDVNSLLGWLLGRFGLFLLWRQREVYVVLESMAFNEVRPCLGTVVLLPSRSYTITVQPVSAWEGMMIWVVVWGGGPARGSRGC